MYFNIKTTYLFTFYCFSWIHHPSKHTYAKCYLSVHRCWRPLQKYDLITKWDPVGQVLSQIYSRSSPITDIQSVDSQSAKSPVGRFPVGQVSSRPIHSRPSLQSVDSQSVVSQTVESQSVESQFWPVPVKRVPDYPTHTQSYSLLMSTAN